MAKKTNVFMNVAVLKEEHEMLRQIAEREQRSMARQLSVLIRKAAEEMELEGRH